MTHHSPTPEMQSCIDACTECHTVCFQTAMTHCLEMGGRHVEPEHFRLMINCAELCQTSANFMLSNSPVHAAVCAACAQVCDACAANCDRIGDMEKCAATCHRCAHTCAAMAAMSGHGRLTGTAKHSAH
ncbi:four-helix bundle copper-binding protein [Massilia glaciei]|uniref:Four-helix bundle copper-binding protein n=1 Tax=Massilia glaciei TaxID=1524097 RepID=A0A2U2HLR7_9BURK|nr:four-helix bundle copper-binding protein [Massilia glaciei]